MSLIMPVRAASLLLVSMTLSFGLAACSSTPEGADPPASSSGDRSDEFPSEVTGAITYLERIALPASAEAHIRIMDIADPDHPVTISEKRVPAPIRIPLSFRIAIDPAQIEPRHHYIVDVELRDGDRVLFRSLESHLVLTRGYPPRSEVLVRRPAPAAP